MPPRKTAPTLFADTTVNGKKPRGAGVPFEKGKSGNPLGRPKGSRHKLEAAFIDALHEAFQEGGIHAIKTIMVDDPAAFLNVIAKVLPKQVETKVQVSINEMSDDELANIASGGGFRAAETEADQTFVH